MRKTGNFDQIKYQNQYNKMSYDRVALLVPKGKRKKIKEYAAKQGKSVNTLLNELIDEKIVSTEGTGEER